MKESQPHPADPNAAGTGAFLRLVDRLLDVRCVEDIRLCLLEELRSLLPFGCMIGGLGRLEANVILPELLLEHDFPSAYLQTIGDPKSGIRSHVLERWLDVRAPLGFELNPGCDQLPAQTLARARRFEFANVLAHGHYASSEALMTYFSFHRIAGGIAQAHRQLIARLMPHLHCALSRAGSLATRKRPHPGAPLPDLCALTARQREIVHWLVLGKTNWEISQIAATSEANVKYHLGQLLRKYMVSSRASLVFKICGSLR